MRKDHKEVRLTPRQIDVISLLCQGYSYQEMAEELDLSIKTVDRHLTDAKFRLRAGNLAELINVVVRLRIIHLEPLTDSFPALTSRETEIVKLLCAGHTFDEVAEILAVSPKTVHAHNNNILTKLRLKSRQELVSFAFRAGLVR